MTELKQVKNTPLDIAKKELNEEHQQKSVKLLKNKLEELHKAETVVTNLKRELEDLEREIDAGIV